MSDYQPKRGDRVRVVLEGEVKTLMHGGKLLSFGDRAGCAAIYYNSPDVSIEKLPAPEPEWQPGDVVIDDNGVLYQRRAPRPDDEAPWVWNIGGMHGRGVIETTPTRPLTHLVRDGKPVSA